MKMADKLKATEEQLAYAGLLDKGMKIGLLALVVTFTLYVTGIMTPHIPVDQLQNYWSMPVKEYLKVTGIHPGWTWLHLLNEGDFINFTGIAFLAGITVMCYLWIIPILMKKKDTIYVVLAILEVLVLTLAASGVLKSGGH